MSYDNLPENPGWKLTRAGQGILLDGESVLLCGNRWYADKPLVWTLPGGRSEEGEGIEQTLIREFKEETGLEIRATALAYVAEARSSVHKQIYLNCAFFVERISGVVSHGADLAVEDLRFVPISELHLYIPAPSLGEALRWHLTHRSSGVRYWFYPEYTS